MNKTNIEEKLRVFQSKSIPDIDILDQVAQILKEDELYTQRIENILTSNSGVKENSFEFDKLESKRIYHISTIKNICINYRLRFLDAKYFKGDIPAEAISQIKEIEKQHNTALKGFKIMAPSKLFKLADKDDPLLFAPIGNGYYYLIHKWGNDLHPLRKILVWPFKNIINLALVTMVVSFLITFLVPSGLFSKTDTSAEFIMIFLFNFKMIGAIVIYYGFARGKNFNPAIWNSKYFNA